MNLKHWNQFLESGERVVWMSDDSSKRKQELADKWLAQSEPAEYSKISGIYILGIIYLTPSTKSAIF